MIQREGAVREHKQRIKLEMSVMDAVIALSEGNPGAAVAMGEMMKAAPIVDPQAAFGPMSPIFALDERGIYGPRIWGLYKDVCDHDAGKALAILRAYQMGQLGGATEAAINRAIDNYGDGLDIKAILTALREELPTFDASRRAVAPAESSTAPTRPPSDLETDAAMRPQEEPK